MNDTFAARNALEAYFTISAVVMSVSNRGTRMPRYSLRMTARASGVGDVVDGLSRVLQEEPLHP